MAFAGRAVSGAWNTTSHATNLLLSLPSSPILSTTFLHTVAPCSSCMPPHSPVHPSPTLPATSASSGTIYPCPQHSTSRTHRVCCASPSPPGAASPPLKYSSEAAQALKYAKAQASRQGQLFVGPDQLLLGLLESGSRATQLLQFAGLDPDTYLSALDERLVVPVNSRMGVGDVELSPVAREVLTYAREGAEELGSDNVGTVHMVMVMLTHPKCGLTGLLAEAGADTKQLLDKLMTLAQSHPEHSAPMVDPQDQVAQLREQYLRQQQQRKEPDQFKFVVQVQPNQGAADDDDDIYN